MPKEIKSHRNLSIRWVESSNSFQLDLRPLGGGHKNFKTKAEALARANEMFEVFQNGKPAVEVKPWTVEEAIDNYLAKAKSRVADPDDKYGPASLGNQRGHLQFIANLPFDGLSLLKRNVSDLSVEFIEDEFWLELKRHNSSITALNRFSSFRQMLQFCVKKRQLEINVCTLAEIKRPNRKAVWDRKVKKAVAKVNPDNLQLILDRVAPQHQLKVLFALETGLRIGEQVAVKIYDPKKPEIGGIDFENNVVHVEQALKKGDTHATNFIGDPKSLKGIRQVPITPALSLKLKEYWMELPIKMKAERWLFPTTHGTIGCGSNWRVRILYAACEKAGLPRDEWPRWHDLRHAFATTYLNNRGNNWVRATELMGHANIQTTMIYKHHVEDPERDQEDAKAVSGGLRLKINSPAAVPEDTTVVKLVAKS